MSQAQQVEIKKETINAAPHLRNQARIAADEAELEAIKRRMRGESDETEEETVEAEPRSESSTPETVQAENNSQQKEKPKAEAQEDDDDLSAEEKTFKQRYGDIRRHMQDKEKEFADKIAKLEKQLDAATKNELVLPKSEEEIEAWAKKYPDVAGIIEAIASKEADKKASGLDARLAEIEELRSTARREKAEAELAHMHPDFNSIREDDAFHDWASEQPKWVQDALYENTDDAKSVARVIDLYKADKGITTKKSNVADKEAASSIKSKRSAPPEADDSSTYIRESQVAKMSIKEYEKRQEEILNAQRSGKFIYDVTKRA
jgi:hypothetical protein